MPSHDKPSRFPYSCTLLLPSADFAPKLCRDFVTGLLPFLGFDHMVDRAALCVSELVTNVHRHAGGLAHLRLMAEAHYVRISVHDRSNALPPPRPEPAAADESGRGLGIVRALADGYGVTDDRLGVFPKGLWFELRDACKADCAHLAEAGDAW